MNPALSPLSPGSYYGQATQRREIADLILTESTYAQDTHIPLHCHENAFFYLVVQGICRDSSEKRERVAEPATLIFHPEQQPHANH